MKEDFRRVCAQLQCLDFRIMHSLLSGLCSFSVSFLLQQGLSEQWSGTWALLYFLGLLHFLGLLKPFQAITISVSQPNISRNDPLTERKSMELKRHNYKSVQNCYNYKYFYPVLVVSGLKIGHPGRIKRNEEGRVLGSDELVPVSWKSCSALQGNSQHPWSQMAECYIRGCLHRTLQLFWKKNPIQQ